MKAIVCETLGAPESLVLRDFPICQPQQGEVQIQIQACGINFPDILMIAGQYQEKPELPFIPCGEVAGVISAVGEGVDSFQVGDPVMAVTYRGGLAEQVNVPASSVYLRPASMPANIAAGFPGVYGTSYHALTQRAVLVPGEKLLVLGAAGGVGHAAVQIGKALGATVIAAASSEEKLDFLRDQGADELINSKTTNLRDAVKSLTNGLGADVIYDPVGGDLFDEAMRCINWNGRLLVVGFASGRIPQVSVNLALLKGVAIVGVFYGRFEKEQPNLARENMAQLCKMYEAGEICPHVHASYPLEQSASALNALKNRNVTGKVVVEI